MQNPEDLIRKLLAMAKGGTEHEAALAAQRANELALKYNIDLIELQTKDAKPNIENEQYDARAQQWISNIISGVCLVNAVEYYRHDKYVGVGKFVCYYRLIGRPHNIRIVKSISDYLIKEVKRLNTEHVRAKDHLDNPAERGAYRKAFRLGASQRLYSRLKAQYDHLRTSDAQAKAVTGSRALVVANYFDQAMQEAADFLKSTGVTITYTKSRGISVKSHEGMQDGRRAGDSISLNSQVTTHASVQRIR